MVPLIYYFGDAIQAVVATFTVILATVSIGALRKRPERRYLLLSVAFVSLCIISVSSVSLELFVGGAPDVIPFAELYLFPSLELLMVLSFLVAVVWSPRSIRPEDEN